MRHLPGILRFLPAIFLGALMGGCIFDDKGGHGEDPPPPGVPAVVWISIAEGQAVSTRDIIVSWRGNEHARKYRFTLDGSSTGWLDTTFHALTGLAEGAHTISVLAANDSLSGEPVTRGFTVNAADGPGVRFSPGTVSATSYVAVILDEMPGVMAIHLEIASPDSAARLREFETGLAAAAAGAVVLADARDPYRLILDIGFPGRPEGFSGSLELGSFIISPRKDSGAVSVDPLRTVFRDPVNRTVTVTRFEPLGISR